MIQYDYYGQKTREMHRNKNGKLNDLVIVAIFNEDWQKIQNSVEYGKAIIEKY